jgi:hypothetical protein
MKTTFKQSQTLAYYMSKYILLHFTTVVPIKKNKLEGGGQIYFLKFKGRVILYFFNKNTKKSTLWNLKGA